MSLDSLSLYCWESIKVQNTIPFWCLQFSLCNQPIVVICLSGISFKCTQWKSGGEVSFTSADLSKTKHLLVYPGIHACAWVTCFISCLVNPLPKRIGGDEGSFDL